MEDKAIVQLFWERDEEALKYTAAKYGLRLRKLARGITSDEQTARECENDTYFEAWNRIPPHNPEQYLYAFLARITRHISIDRCRESMSRKRSGIVETLSDELEQCLPAADTVEGIVDAKLLGEAIGRFLLTLSTEKRVIFMRRYFYFDTVEEISRQLQISESKVKVTLFRLRNGLHEYLRKESGFYE